MLDLPACLVGPSARTGTATRLTTTTATTAAMAIFFIPTPLLFSLIIGGHYVYDVITLIGIIIALVIVGVNPYLGNS